MTTIKKPENEFKTLVDYAEKMRKRYFNTLAAFKIYEGFCKLSAPNVVGRKKAEKNVRILKNFRYFFITTKESTRCYFFIELAKFFDTSTQSLTINKVIDYAEKNIGKFTKKDFLKYHEGRKILPELFAEYRPLTLCDLKKIKKRLFANKAVINNLKIYRDKYLAHDDIKKIKVEISPREVIALLDIVKSTIGLLYSKLDFSVNSYTNFEKNPVEELDEVVENLIKYEQHRLDELKRERRVGI